MRAHFRVVHHTMNAAIASAVAISTSRIQKPFMCEV
jgi:hypothetical protein